MAISLLTVMQESVSAAGAKNDGSTPSRDSTSRRASLSIRRDTPNLPAQTMAGLPALRLMQISISSAAIYSPAAAVSSCATAALN